MTSYSPKYDVIFARIRYHSFLNTKSVKRKQGLFYTSNDFIYRLATMAIQPFVYTIAHLQRNLWVNEISSTNLYCSCTCHQKLYGISSRRYTAKSYNRYFNSMSNIVNHAKSYRFNCWATESASANT